MKRSAVLVSLALTVLAASCSKSNSEPAPAASAGGTAPAVTSPPAKPVAPPAVPDASKGSCEITVTGDVQETAVSPGGPSAVGTDYWMTPAELDKAVEMMVNALQPDKSKIPAEIEKAKQREPKLMLLIVNCSSEKVHLTLSPSGDARYKDVPFGPGKYAINKKPASNEFGAMLLIDHKSYQVTDPGTLEISKFDPGGITGTFQFAAERTDFTTKETKKITVKGKLDLPCATHSQACKR